MDRAEILGKLGATWKRALVPYDGGDLYCVYADEALTGWALIVDEPNIGNFNNQKTLMIPFATWVLIKTLASESVTPFRIVAKGKGLIAGAWRPHTGLKYAIRNEASGPASVHIPLEDLKPV